MKLFYLIGLILSTDSIQQGHAVENATNATNATKTSIQNKYAVTEDADENKKKIVIEKQSKAQSTWRAKYPEKLFVEADDADPCGLPMVVGECRAAKPQFYFDAVERRCKSFYYGGCGGNANNFDTLDECMQRCDFCELPVVVSQCRLELPRFYFDAAEGRCKSFIYGGCNGNRNNFVTIDECAQRCGGATKSDEAAMWEEAMWGRTWQDPCYGYTKPCEWYPKDGRGYDTICSMTGCEGKAFGCSKKGYCWSTCSLGSRGMNVGWRWLNMDPSKEHTVPDENRGYWEDFESGETIGWLTCNWRPAGRATPCEAYREAIGKQIRCYNYDTTGVQPGVQPGRIFPGRNEAGAE